MKRYYIEKKDKHAFKIYKLKFQDDNIFIYDKLEKEKNIKKIVNSLNKRYVKYVILSKELCKNKAFINVLNANSIRIFDGRWLEKYLIFEILDYVIEQLEIKREETEIAVTTNEITDISLEVIRNLSKQYKKLSVVTNHIEKLQKIEKDIYENDGILIVVSNNQRKSLLRTHIIVNLDFNKEVLNKYRINENAIIINLEGDMRINSKRFEGLNVNNYEIELEDEDFIWRENMKSFWNKDLLEARLYCKDTYQNLRNKIDLNKIFVKNIYGINGEINLKLVTR